MTRTGIQSYSRAFSKLRQILGKKNIENPVTASHCARCVPEGMLGMGLRLVKGLPYVCYVHGEELNIYSQSKELRYLARVVMKGAASFIVNSRNTKAILATEWGIEGERIHLLHPGVDTTKFHPSAPQLHTRARLGWNDRAVILTVGRLQRRKGHDMLIRALPAIRGAIPNVLYSIVGDGEERPLLESLVRELDVEQLVQFRGESSEDDMIQCYQQCDLFVLPNREVEGDFEGFGMVLVEAQACGKPVVAGMSGGTCETMNPPHTGLLVDCTTPDHLAHNIVGLLRDDEHRIRMGEAARQWAVERFDWTALALQARAMFAKIARQS